MERISVACVKDGTDAITSPSNRLYQLSVVAVSQIYGALERPRANLLDASFRIMRRSAGKNSNERGARLR